MERADTAFARFRPARCVMTKAGFRRIVLSALVFAIMGRALAGAGSLNGQDAVPLTPGARAARIEKGLLPGIIIKEGALGPGLELSYQIHH